jgi:hypothetical protein
MYNDSFMPSQNAGPTFAGGQTGGYSTIVVTPAPTTSSAVVSLPPGGEVLELQNSGTVIVYVEFGIKTATATVPTATAGSYPILGGQCKLIKRPLIGGVGADVIATITGTGTGTLSVSAGGGQ